MCETEKTVDTRTHKGEKQCKVKWKGCTHAHNSWEEYDHIEGIFPETVKVFEKEKEEKAAASQAQAVSTEL